MDIRLDTRDARIPRRSHYKLARLFSGGLRRLAGKVRSMNVSLTVQRGRQRDADKICQMQLQLEDGSQIVIRKRARRFAVAMKRCMERARKLLIVQSQRQRTLVAGAA